MARSYTLEPTTITTLASPSMTSFPVSITASTSSSSSVASVNSLNGTLVGSAPLQITSSSTSSRPVQSGSSLFQIAASLIYRLNHVPGLSIYLSQARLASPTDSPSMLLSASNCDANISASTAYMQNVASEFALNDIDPVTQLWRFFRQGTSLCVLFNALNQSLNKSNASNIQRDLIVPEPLSHPPSQQDLKTCKRGVYEFVQACKSRLGYSDDNLFTIMNVFSDDTTDLLKVTGTVTLVLEYWEDLQPADMKLQQDVVPFEDEGSNDGEKQTDNRIKVVHELLHTERKYVQDLELLQAYMKQLQVQEILSADTIHFLFPNLNTLVDFQRKFLVGIEKNARLSIASQHLGSLFVNMEHSFSVYETYASQQKHASNLALQEVSKLAKLKYMIEPTFELPSLLIKPIQRICKYPLLLKELIKYTAKSDEIYNELVEGFNAMKRVTDRVNETQRQAENKETVMSLCARIDDWKGHNIDNFGSLLHDGTFLISDVDREYHVYLFENILIVCKEESGPPLSPINNHMIRGGTGVGTSTQASSSSVSLASRTPSGSNTVQSSNVSMALTNLPGSVSNRRKKTILPAVVVKKPSFSFSSAGSGSLTLEGRIYIDNITDIRASSTKTVSPIDPSHNNIYLLNIFWRGDSDTNKFTMRFRNEELLRQWEATLKRLMSFDRRRTNSSEAFRSYTSESHGDFNGQNSVPHPLSPIYSLSTTNDTTRPISSSSFSSSNMYSPTIERISSTNSLGQAQTIKLKLFFQNDSYILLMPSSVTFDDVATKIDRKLRRCNAAFFEDIGKNESNVAAELRYKLKYKDEDGDLILLESEEDWEVVKDSISDDGSIEVWVI
ncbi:hypothetical protein V1511DRAFT_455917 [Dipodascopsis uninucleata]